MFSAIILDSSALEQYAKRLSTAMVQQHFPSSLSRISGGEIKDFCSVRQVNLLVIRQLFGKWQGEMAQLKSPFFDFQHEEVKEGLKRFMNLLSQHISVAEFDFLPLLEKAIVQTFELYANPVAWFTAEINKLSTTTITQANVGELSKYLDSHKPVCEYILEDMRSRNNAQMFKGEMSRLATFYINEYGQNLPRLELLVEAFSSIVPISQEELCGLKAADEAVNAVLIADTPTTNTSDDKEPHSFFDSLNSSPAAEVEEPIVPETTESPQEEAIELKEQVIEEPSGKVTITLSSSINNIIPLAEEALLKPTSAYTSFDAHEDSAPTALEAKEMQLKDMLKGEPQVNLNAQFAATKEVPDFVKQAFSAENSMRKMIKMNDKFIFVEKLFQSKVDEYDAALDEIDTFNTKYDAMKFVLDNLAIHYNWDLNKKVPTQFVSLVEKKFGDSERG